jgi:putative transcriptional regulator
MSFSFKIETGLAPSGGKILIAEPLLADPHFQRGVVYLCEHTSEGSYGFVLNKPLDKKLDYFIEAFDIEDVPVYLGGPVDSSALHFLHRRGELLGGEKTEQDIFFDGDFPKAIEALKNKTISRNEILFFLGYAGWSAGQLQQEVHKKSWLVAETNQQNLFTQKSETLWKESILALDKEYHILTTLPKDPNLN